MGENFSDITVYSMSGKDIKCCSRRMSSEVPRNFLSFRGIFVELNQQIFVKIQRENFANAKEMFYIFLQYTGGHKEMSSILADQ